MSRVLRSSLPEKKRKGRKDGMSSPIVKKLKEFDDNPFPLLDLPNEILFRTFPYFDLEDRMKMRSIGNKRLNEIEKETKFRYGSLEISYITLPKCTKDLRLVCDGFVVNLSHSAALKEFEILEGNTHFNLVAYKTCIPGDRSICQSLSFLKAKTIEIAVLGIDDITLDMVIHNKERVIVRRSNVTSDGLWSKMKEGSVGVKYVKVETHSVEPRFRFLERLGKSFSRINGFVPKNDSQQMKYDDFQLVVTEGNLRIVASVLCWCGRFAGFVSFEIIDGEDKAEKDSHDNKQCD